MSDKEKENEELTFNVGDLVAGYKIIEKIDEGGFGQVFKVSQNDQIYAMKIESNQQEGGSAIKLEIDVLWDLKAKKVPNFPQVVQAGKKIKYHFLVMELLGDNLKTLRYKSSNPDTLSPGTWSRIGIQCLYVVKLLHDNGFVHRDIKPSNFAMGYGEDALKSRLIYLFDFGLARRFVLKAKDAKKDVPMKLLAHESNPELKKEKPVEEKKESARERGGGNGGGAGAKKLNRALQGKDNMKKAMGKVKMSKRNKQDVSKYEDLQDSEKKSTEPISACGQYKFRIARPRTDFRGTQQYASPNAHLLIELGRADDVWSLMYMLAEMVAPLPWAVNEELPIDTQKNQANLHGLFKIASFEKIDENLKSCNYYSAPDYNLCYQTLKSIMDESGAKWLDPYDWESDNLPAFSKWKEEKAKQKIVYGWEDPKDYFKHEAWSNLVKPVKNEKLKDEGKKKEVDDTPKDDDNKLNEVPSSEERKSTPHAVTTPPPPSTPQKEKKKLSAETCEAPSPALFFVKPPQQQQQQQQPPKGTSVYDGCPPVNCPQDKKSARKKVWKKSGGGSARGANGKSTQSKSGPQSNRNTNKFLRRH